jgi:hypothetical protein
MAFTTTTATNILKNRYIGPINEQLEQSSVLWAELKKEVIKVSGKNWTVPLHTRRNLSAGTGRAEMGTLPTASEQQYSQAIIPKAHQYGTFEISGPAFTAMRDDAGAFARALSSEAEGLADDMIKSFNRQFHSDGTDALAYWFAADDDSTYLVSDNQGNPFTHLQVGHVVDVIDASDNSTVLGTLTITGLSIGTTSVTVTATETVAFSGSAAGDYAVIDDTLGLQMMGIRGIISASNPPLLSGGLHGIPVSGNDFWQAQVFDNPAGAGTNRALSSLLMRKPISAIASRSNARQQDIKFILTSYEGYDEYYNLCLAEKRQVNTLKLDSGFKGLDFSGIPVVPDPDCRKNVYYYIVPKSLAIYQDAPLDWMERDGNMLHRRENTDSYFARMFMYANLGTRARNQNAVLRDVAISVA